MAYDADAVYLGTQAGVLYAHDRSSGGWTVVASDLPEILSVEAAEWS